MPLILKLYKILEVDFCLCSENNFSKNSMSFDSTYPLTVCKAERPTGSLAQAGVLPRGTPRRILAVQLPSEPYRYPRLPQAAKTLGESLQHADNLIS